jgi:hypothetical protein
MNYNMQQVPDELERVLVGIESYISIRRHFDDIAFSVFETDEGNSPNKKVLVISCLCDLNPDQLKLLL